MWVKVNEIESQYKLRKSTKATFISLERSVELIKPGLIGSGEKEKRGANPTNISTGMKE